MLDYDDDDLYNDLIYWANEQGYINVHDLETEKYLPKCVKEFLKNF